MEDEDPELRVKAKRRAARRAFDARVETWLRPPKVMDSDLADELASVMGKDLYALYTKQLNINAVARAPEPENMLPQAVMLRENNGKMLLHVVVSAQFGSKWEGDVTLDITDNAEKFLEHCQEVSGLKLASYTVSFNGRLLTPENVLHTIGVRDGNQVVLLPMGQALNYRPNWSVRQTDAVVAKMEERHKKLKLSASTQNLMRESLGRELYRTIDSEFKIIDKDAIDPDEDDKTRRARELKEKKMKDAEFERTNLYGHTWGERPKAEYQRRELRPLAGFCTEQAKLSRASRPLQNYEEAMKTSTMLALQGKTDPVAPRLDSLKQWFAAYGESENFFKAGNNPTTDTVGKATEFGFINCKPLGVMSRFERSRRTYGKDRSQAVTLKRGNLAA